MTTFTPPALAQIPGESATAAHGRRVRLRAAAAARGVPLATILVTVAVVALTYLAGKLAYRLRDVILMIVVAGFIALILNPLVVALQRSRAPFRSSPGNCGRPPRGRDPPTVSRQPTRSLRPVTSKHPRGWPDERGPPVHRRHRHGDK